MPREKDAFLLDMFLAAEDAVSFAEGQTLSEFLQNTEKQRGIVHAVQQIPQIASKQIKLGDDDALAKIRPHLG